MKKYIITHFQEVSKYCHITIRKKGKLQKYQGSSYLVNYFLEFFAMALPFLGKKNKSVTEIVRTLNQALTALEKGDKKVSFGLHAGGGYKLPGISSIHYYIYRLIWGVGTPVRKSWLPPRHSWGGGGIWSSDRLSDKFNFWEVWGSGSWLRFLAQ